MPYIDAVEAASKNHRVSHRPTTQFMHTPPQDFKKTPHIPA